MFPYPLPVERVGGRSRGPWIFASLAPMVVGMLLGEYVADGKFPAVGPFGSLPALLISLGVALAVCFPLTLVFMAAVPVPADVILLAPGGIGFEVGGIGTSTWVNFLIPPGRLRMIDDRLFVLPKRFGLATAYSLTPWQVHRVKRVLPGIVG